MAQGSAPPPPPPATPDADGEPSAAHVRQHPEKPKAAAASELADSVLAQLLFSTRRPRDVCAGVSSAVKSVCKGVLFGCAALVAAPVYASCGGEADPPADQALIEKDENGLPDAAAVSKRRAAKATRLAVGVGAGLCGALMLPLAGAIVGAVQIIRGCFNTPVALYQILRGEMTWDVSKREWTIREVYSLPEEAEKLKEDKSSEESGVVGGRKEVASMEYYELLGVRPEASAGDVKKAYYRVARGCHPDKCGEDPAAKARFQALSHAYQVLSDPQLRAAYDRDGAEATKEIGMTDYDAAVFFGALFGSERFENYVGELALAQIGSLLTKRGGAFESVAKVLGEKQSAHQQQQEGDPGLGDTVAAGIVESREMYSKTQRGREITLALQLRDLLEPYVKLSETDDDAAFVASCAKEAGALAASEAKAGSLTNGALCSAMSRAYSLAADEWLGKHDSYMLGVGSYVAQARSRTNATVAYASAAKASVRGLLAAKKLTEEMNKKPDDDEEEAAPEKKKKPAASREELRGLGIGRLKKVATANKVSLSGCVEKSHIVDALFDAKVVIEEEEEEKKEDEKKAKRSRGSQAAIEAQMPVFLEALLQISLYDVQCTLTKVTDKVLLDESVDVEIRKRRAVALRIFGGELEKALVATNTNNNLMVTASPPPTLVDGQEAEMSDDDESDEEKNGDAPAKNDGERQQVSSKTERKKKKQAVDKAAATKRFEHAVSVTMAKAMGQEMSEPDPSPSF